MVIPWSLLRGFLQGAEFLADVQIDFCLAVMDFFGQGGDKLLVLKIRKFSAVVNRVNE